MVNLQEGFIEKCTGCFACANSCPSDAIRMVWDAEGFYYPIVDSEKCTKCGKCTRVCAVSSDINVPKAERNTYSYLGTDEIRCKSSSGGLFYSLANAVINEGGAVFGAYFDKQSKLVKHDSTDNVSLDELMRSKYVQSEIGNTYSQVKRILIQGRNVLFCGTPCQVFGLKSYLGKDYDNLLTVDFCCHGVPSSRFFQDMLLALEKKNKSKIVDVTFREKDFGWRKQAVKFYFDNGETERYVSKEFYYYKFFLRNITLRHSCFSCQFPANHYSDISIMDYWQIRNDDDKGVSACTANTDKGEKLLHAACGEGLSSVDYKSISSCMIPHTNIKDYKRYYSMRNSYLAYYAKNGFENTINKLNPRYHRIISAKDKISIAGGTVKLKLKKLLGR